jgi:hypothetical protein
MKPVCKLNIHVTDGNALRKIVWAEFILSDFAILRFFLG